MPRSYNPRNTRKYASDEERRIKAHADWLAGMSYRAVAEKYEYSDHSSAMRAIALVRKAHQDGVEEARDQAVERIMGPLMVMRQLALDGDPQAAGQHKAYEERLAKMWGLDMPIKTDVTSDGRPIIMVNPDRLPLNAPDVIEGEYTETEDTDND